jgi:hypothetical protein
MPCGGCRCLARRLAEELRRGLTPVTETSLFVTGLAYPSGRHHHLQAREVRAMSLLPGAGRRNRAGIGEEACLIRFGTPGGPARRRCRRSDGGLILPESVIRGLWQEFISP